MAAIEIRSLRKEFEVPDGVEIAVDDVNIEIDDQEFVTIVGPSGCGKTTTLRCIAGLEQPTSGVIEINDRDVTEIPPNKRNLSMMFQNIALYPHMTIRENITYPLKISKVSTDIRKDRAKEVAEIMQIPDLLDKYPAELSGGQRQRAALARTIIQQPTAFLMDEPLSDLDAKLKIEIRKEIQRVHKQLGKPTVYVTHDQEEALTMSDKIIVMNDGEIEQIGTPDELYHNPRNTFVAKFIGNPSMNFLNGTLAERGDSVGDLQILGKEFSFEFESTTNSVPSPEISVGFRPETVSLDDGQEDFRGEVILVERIGERHLATIECQGTELRATVGEGHGLIEEEPVSIGIDQERVFVFDRNGGDLIAKGQSA